MGKGDKKTKRGKITLGSYGKSRPRPTKKAASAPIEEKPVVAKAKAPAKESAAKATEAKATKAKTTKKTKVDEPAEETTT